MSDFVVTSARKLILILLHSGATLPLRTARNADDHLRHSETISRIWDGYTCKEVLPVDHSPECFPSSAVSRCSVTRCRGRQVYLVWQVTLHLHPPWLHVRLTQTQWQLPQVTEYRLHLCLNASHIPMRSSLAYSFGLFLSLQEPAEEWILPGWHLCGCLAWILCCYPHLLGQVLKPSQNNPGWAPFLMKQKTLMEYKLPPCIKLPNSAEDGRRSDKQKPAFKASVVNINE